MLDFNGVEPARPFERFDLDAIIARLRDTAEAWVPRYFPNGRRVGDDWRLANINGAPPRKNGSCVIALKGERAGDWHDFDGDHGGGPLTTLGHGAGLSGHELLVLAATEVGQEAVTSRARTKGSRQSSEDVEREIARILAKAVPIAGTGAERYLAERGLNVPNIPDLLFNDDLTHWETKRGFPGMVAIVRDSAGAQIALHRTYLDPQQPAKADVSPARKTLGRVGGGGVRLAAPRDGLIGLAEGIETALAVMTTCPDLPVWATLSTSGMEGIVLPPDVARVVLLADHDDAGRRAAEATAAKLIMEGRRVFKALPPHQGEDFNDLLLREGPEAVRAVVEAAAEINPRKSGSTSWNAGLLRSRDGKVLPILANAIYALRNAPEWEGALWHDEFAMPTAEWRARRPHCRPQVRSRARGSRR
jgi:putative DNA primase/helicase